MNSLFEDYEILKNDLREQAKQVVNLAESLQAISPIIDGLNKNEELKKLLLTANEQTENLLKQTSSLFDHFEDFSEKAFAPD